MPILPNDSDIHEPTVMEVSRMAHLLPICFNYKKLELDSQGKSFILIPPLRKHVFSDLQPYVCTFENCSVDPFPTRNQWFQHEMDSHRRRWECILCASPRPTFSQRTQISTHFEEHHKGLVTENQMDVIMGACETPMALFDGSACPLCTEWEPPLDPVINMREFRRHLARHLQQISLEALPLYIEGLEIRQEDPDESDIVEWKKGRVLDNYIARSIRELSVAEGDEVMILSVDKDWWMVRVLRDGRQGLIPSSNVIITGTSGNPSQYSGMYCLIMSLR